MKRLVLLFAASLMLGGAVMAQDETGAIGFGVVLQSSNGTEVSKNLRFNLFLDAGTKLWGPFHYGFEFQGDVKKMSQSTSDIQSTDVTAYGLGGNDYVIFIKNNLLGVESTVWDLDVSPRGYISFDMGNKIQLLGFLGLNYNWQTFDTKYTNKNAVVLGAPTANQITLNNGTVLAAGGSATNSYSPDGTWTPVAGVRFALGVFYVDYTRFLVSNDTGNYSFNQYNKDRFGLGLDLRF